MPTSDLSQEIIYQVLIDRFTGDPGLQGEFPPVWCGGTIEGVTGKLDYLQSFGVTSVMLTPFFKGEGYHGYHTTDFAKVDERFGTLRDLKQLSRELHERGMRLIIDYVPNHCHDTHPFFVDASQNPASPYRDWFIFDEWPKQFKTFLWSPDLPKFNFANPSVRRYFIDNALLWLDEIDYDGMRIDHAIGPPMAFWPKFIPALKARKPELFFIGEVRINKSVTLERRDRVALSPLDLWLGQFFIDTIADKYLRLYLKHFDAVLDFTFWRLATLFASGDLTLEQLKRKLERHYARLPKGAHYPTFLDNPDVNRVLFSAGGDVERVKQLIDLQFELGQPIVINYGTEQDMTQTKGNVRLAPYGDLPARPCPDWRHAEDHELIKHYRALSARAPVPKSTIAA